MADYNGTAGNDGWNLVTPGTFSLDGLGGIDTLSLGTSLRSSYTITESGGAVHIDSISSASGALHATLFNMEILTFNNGTDTLDLTTFFAPTVVFTDNVLGTATGNVTYTLTFNKAVTGLTSSDFMVTNGTVLSVTGSGSSYSVVTAPVSGTEGLQYLTLNAGAVTESAGYVNKIAFTAAVQTIDTKPPLVTSDSPLNQATGVAVASNIVFTFDESIQRGSGNIVIVDGTGNTVATYAAATSSNLSFSANQLTINPTADLAFSTNYTVQLGAGSVKDVVGNATTSASVLGFTTIAPPNSLPTGSVLISGTATQGQTLTASNTLADADGMGLIAYLWKADGTAINGAATNTLILAEAQVGKLITVTASYVDGHGTGESVASAATSPVLNVNDVPTGGVTISGNLALGQVLSAGNTLTDADGLGSITYQWQSSLDGNTWSNLSSGSTLGLTDTLAGQQLRVLANYVDGHGTTESVASLATPTISGNTLDVLAYSWKAHTLLSGVSVTTGTHGGNTDTQGSLILNAITDSHPQLSVTSSAASTGTLVAEGQAVNLQDAIAILKMIVGLDVNGAGKPLSPYQVIAADYDGNGTVGLNDAISILKHVVGLSAPDPHWRFVNEVDPAVVAQMASNPSVPATLPATIAADLSSGPSAVHVDLVGILTGDVDGSFVGSPGSTALSTQYFNDLLVAHPALGISLTQFGIYPP